MKTSTKGYRKPKPGEFILREGWYWPGVPCVNGHFSPRNKQKNCVQCIREYRARKGHFVNDTDRAWRAINREKLNENRIEYNRNNPEKTLHTSAKLAAKRKGVPFDLLVSDIIIPDRCPIFGVKLERGSRDRWDCSPSLDRIAPSKGYVRGNIVVICWRANRLKQDASIEELRKMLNFYEGLI